MAYYFVRLMLEIDSLLIRTLEVGRCKHTIYTKRSLAMILAILLQTERITSMLTFLELFIRMDSMALQVVSSLRKNRKDSSKSFGL